jgi:tetratricopeptide (TPR) repeat protein
MGESPRTDNPRIDELRRRVQADPASIAFAALAEEYRRVGRFEEAIETCTAGLKRHPSYLSAHVTLGRALIEVGRFSEAEQELQLVLRAAPENLAAIRGLADIHNRRNEGQEGVQGSGFRVQGSDVPAPVAPEPEPVSWMPPASEEAAPSVYEPPSWQPAPEPEPEPAPPAPIFQFKTATEPEPSPVVPEPSAFGYVNTPSESTIEEWRTTHAEPRTENREPAESHDAATVAALEEFLSAIRRARANS